MKYVKFSLSAILLGLLLSNCGGNSAPLTPNSPQSSMIGIPKVLNVFRASTTDPDGDDISYQFDWGDGAASAWSDFIPSGDTISVSRLYIQKGTYQVRVKAQDEQENMSGWSNPLSLLVGYPDTIVGWFSIGNNPFDIEILPNDEYVYVTNGNDNNVTVLNCSNLLATTIPVGNAPIGVTALPNSQYVYVMVYLDSLINIIKTSDNTITDTIEPVPLPLYAAALPDGEYLYVATARGIFIIETSSNTVVDSTSHIAYRIVVLPNGERIYISISNSIDEIRISDKTTVDHLNLSDDVFDMATTPDGQYLYISVPDADRVFVLRTSDNTVIDTVEVGHSPQGLCVHPSGQLVYVANYNDDNVSVIYTPTNTVIKNIPMDNGPKHLVASNNGEYIYVVHANSHNCWIIGYSE